jgi:hypothetical protein
MFNRCDAIVTNTVDLLGTTPAHAFGQINQRNIEFILEERGIGARAAGTDITLVEDYRVESFFCQALRGECARDAGTQDDYIAAQILLQCWINAQ